MFTDKQIQLMSKDFLLIPEILNAVPSGFVYQKEVKEQMIEDARELDEIVKIYFDECLNKIKVLHQKIYELTGKKRADYDLEYLDLGMKGDGPHFPHNWSSFYPKQTLNVTGLPTEGIAELDWGTEKEKEYTELNYQLGNVKQNLTGTFEGKGLYHRFFELLCLRISKGDGTLTRVYEHERAYPFLVKKIADANVQLKIYEETFAITQVLFDTVTGQREFWVKDVTGFCVGDSVKLMNNHGNVVNRIITDIDLNRKAIQVNTGLSFALTRNAYGRIVKIK